MAFEIGGDWPNEDLSGEEGVSCLLVGEEALEPEDVGCCDCEHPDPSHYEVDDCGDVFRYGYDNGYRYGGDTRPCSYSRMALLWPTRWNCSLWSGVNHERRR